MVNEPLRPGARIASPDLPVLGAPFAGDAYPLWNHAWQLKTADGQIIRHRPANAAVELALRTLEAGQRHRCDRSRAAGPLGRGFADCRRPDPRRQGPRHRHRARQIRPCRAQNRGDLASTGTPAFFVHAAEAGHGDLGMITADDVILALSWSGEQPEMKDLITYSTRFRSR